MKLLAIHSNKIFFEQDTIEEDVPNFYDWLAEERGVVRDITIFHILYKYIAKSFSLGLSITLGSQPSTLNT